VFLGCLRVLPVGRCFGPLRLGGAMPCQRQHEANQTSQNRLKERLRVRVRGKWVRNHAVTSLMELSLSIRYGVGLA
jgi:hypothetical protein